MKKAASGFRLQASGKSGKSGKSGRTPEPRVRSPKPEASAVIRRVERSNAETAAEVARRLGVSIATVRRRAQRGELRAVISADGHYHFPRPPSPARKAKKKPPFRKKKASGRSGKSGKSGRTPEPRAQSPKPKVQSPTPARSTPPARKKQVRKTKKRAPKKKVAKKRRPVPPPAPPPRKRPEKPGKKKTGKKKRAKKKIRRPRPPPPPPPPPPPIPPGYVPNPFGGPPIPGPDYEPPEVSAASPMPVGTAAQMVGHAMADYVMARTKIERELTHRDFYALKHAFRTTYGVEQWHETFEWIVDEWDLEDYIFDREALRDS